MIGEFNWMFKTIESVKRWSNIWTKVKKENAIKAGQIFGLNSEIALRSLSMKEN